MLFKDFECDRCGACCQTLLVEAGEIDARREPRLFQIDPEINRERLWHGDAALLLWDVEKRACPFLDLSNNDCGIYATRPTACVSVEAGDIKCQQARLRKRLPILRDKHGNEPTREMMEMSAETYGMEYEDVFDD